MEELNNRLMNLKWNERHTNEGYRLSFLVFCEYRKKTIAKKKHILSQYLLPDVCELIISYLNISTQLSLDGKIEYESPDEKQVHDHALIQIESRDRMQIIINNNYLKLFIDDINRLAEHDHRVTVRYDDLNIILDAPISIVVPERQYYEEPLRHPISLYNLNTNHTQPIIGIGRIVDDPTTILILIKEWCSANSWWVGSLYRQTIYDKKLRNLYPTDWNTILDRLHDVGVFYVVR